MQTNRGWARRFLPGALALGLMLPLAACDVDELLEVTDPAALPAEDLSGANAVPSLARGAVREFFVGYSGAGDDAYLTSSGVLSDELYNGDTFTTRTGADQRRLQVPQLGNVSDPAFLRLQRARISARRAAAAVQQFTPEDKALFSRMRTIEGFAMVTLGEGWCGHIPFSRVPETGPIDPNTAEPGMPLTTTQVMDSAIVRFDEALTANPNNHLASIGKARALLNKGGSGNIAAAAAIVAKVPTTFVFHVEHSSNTGSQNNPAFSLIANGRYGVSNDEGGTERPDDRTHPATDEGEGVLFRASRDPRVPWVQRGSAGRCFTSSFNCYFDQKYPSFDADVPIASGVEARLIEAEAMMRAGNPAYLTKLNELRSRVAELLPVLYPNIAQTFPAPPAPPSLAPLTLPATAAGQRQQVFEERAMWMYFTGHRLGDLRRLVRDYGLSQNEVFPTGTFYRGGTYGTDVNFPLPFNEQNNPNFKADQCVTSQA